MISRGFLVLVGFFLLVWLCASGIARSARSQSADTSTLETSGEGRVELAASRAEATVAIVLHEATLEDLNAHLGQASHSLQEFLSGQRAEKIRTETVSVNPHNDFVNGAAKPNGFDGRISVHFEVPVEKVGELVTGSLAHGATAVEGVRPFVSDADRTAARGQAIALAVRDAQAKARAALDAAGLKEGAIRHLSINADQPGPRPFLRAMALKAAPASAPVPIDVQGGTQEVTASAQLTVDIR
ncbi:MAG: SIMPL domain-containing protein [Verrucomicrobium sp.]|nr:SIMPL domain-containing protein [Verrucomicrobium sp.]